MNKIFFRSNYNSYKNGNLVDNSEERLEYEDNKGVYTHKKFGKLHKKKNIKKRDIDNYINSRLPNYYITQNVFDDAINILNNSVANEFSPLMEGSDKTLPKKKNVIDNGSKIKKRNNRCDLISKKYNLSEQNSKKEFRKIYKKKALSTHPDKCKTKKCEEEFKLLNDDYHFYYDTENNC